mgnify:CR=1 FL=1
MSDDVEHLAGLAAIDDAAHGLTLRAARRRPLVLAAYNAGPNAVAKVDFGTEGTKRLLLRYSPVTKL